MRITSGFEKAVKKNDGESSTITHWIVAVALAFAAKKISL